MKNKESWDSIVPVYSKIMSDITKWEHKYSVLDSEFTEAVLDNNPIKGYEAIVKFLQKKETE